MSPSMKTGEYMHMVLVLVNLSPEMPVLLP